MVDLVTSGLLTFKTRNTREPDHNLQLRASTCTPAYSTTESGAENDPQGWQMPSNSRRAAKPRADTHLSRTEAKLLVSQSYKLPTPANRLPSNYDEHAPFSHHECTRQVFKQSYREPCPVKISLYLATYYIGNVRSTTSVLGNQSTGLKGDAVCYRLKYKKVVGHLFILIMYF